MTLRLQIVRDNEIIFDLPLSPTDWSPSALEDELETFEDDFHQLSKIFAALSNETRLLMMKHLIEQRRRAINFSDFMKELSLNPKLVWENTKKLRAGGLLRKVGRGQYRCSTFGESSFLMMSLGLRHLIHFCQLEDL
jgi:DNA-binding transcriptional ArsR family regulator